MARVQSDLSHLAVNDLSLPQTALRFVLEHGEQTRASTDFKFTIHAKMRIGKILAGYPFTMP